MALFDSLFGKGRKVASARTAELRGDLARAAALYGEAGQPDEAARIMLLRAQGETDARARLQFYAQAAQLSSDGTAINKDARRKRAALLLALTGNAAVSAVARHEILEAARELEAVGEPREAAEAFARAGDKEGEARALQAAGDVEGLEFLLSTEQSKERISRARDDRAKDVDLMIEAGRRRDALTSLQDLLRSPDDSRDDGPLRERVNALLSRKVSAPIVVLDAGGERWMLVLGDEVVIGRTEGAIKIASNAVSRQHLRISREGGAVVAKDLESRNGTQMRGVNLKGRLPVGDGLELKLGKEVPLRIAPSKRLAGAIEIDVGGARYVACLGPGRTPVAGLELVPGPDGWVELVARGAHAYLGEVELVPRATLLVGDAIATTRGGEPVLRVHGS